jgi:hypothetical protein
LVVEYLGENATDLVKDFLSCRCTGHDPHPSGAFICGVRQLRQPPETGSLP